MSEKSAPTGKARPKLRGYFHQEAFFLSLGACLMLVFLSESILAFVASIIYSVGILCMFGVSAIYHRVHWEPKPRAIMKRLDHSAIFILIASTSTPIGMFALSEQSGFRFMILIWSVAAVGVLQSLFWLKAPKWFNALFYVAMGWMAFPYLSEMKESMGTANVWLLVSGGLVYTFGAVFYALRMPKLSPKWFSYHELFHIFTIIGAVLHFIVVYQVIH